MSKFPSVLLVEDESLLRLGLRISLERLGCCEILGEVGSGEAAVRETQRLRPEIILMDIGLPGIDGIEATWRIKNEFPRTRIVMFTARNTPDDVTAALGAGADGYCAKDSTVEHIASAIETVMRGEVWLDPAIADTVINGDELTKVKTVSFAAMEMQILEMIKNGENNAAIAKQLKTTKEAVARAMRNVMQRFMVLSEPAEKVQSSARVSSNEWLTVFVENLDEGRVFADKYLIENLLGAGGVGAVFKAKHLYIDRYVALKLLQPQLSQDRLAMRTFQREAMAIANVQHKNIVSVYDFGISCNQEPFLVMEYVDGTDLAEILTKESTLSVQRVINLAVQICSGLVEAHSKGIIHCDLKPSNILILGQDPQETVKLVDFGLAQILPHESTVQSQLTDKFFVCGTPLYMPPEQCAGEQLDARSDIYSLGCILYEALTGVRIFEGKTALETFAKQSVFVPPPMSSIHPQRQFSAALEACVSSMLAKKPADRPQSMKEVMKQLLSS